MPKHRPRIFSDPAKVQFDSEGNQSIDLRELASDPRVREEVAKLREGFLAEQKYRASLITQAKSHVEAETATPVAEDSREVTSERLKGGKEKPANRFMENESS